MNIGPIFGLRLSIEQSIAMLDAGIDKAPDGFRCSHTFVASGGSNAGATAKLLKMLGQWALARLRP